MREDEILQGIFRTIQSESILINDIGEYQGFLVGGGNKNKTVNQIFKSFDDLMKIWETAITDGKDINIERIKRLITEERTLILAGRQFVPDYTKQAISNSGILSSFLEKLRTLSFKQVVLRNGNSLKSCNCRLRLTHRLNPLSAYLYEIGEGVHAYLEYTVFKCRNCSVGWVHDDVGDDTGGRVWMEWDEKDYPLRS